jgi:asparagine synthase (glutamine-hydrolysing)
MCGIAGFVGMPLAKDAATARLHSMCDAIVHRGPDDAGYYVEDGVALGMRRLSIIDLTGGHQPISNEDGSVTVVFNGEIYNHRALREELEASGHRFRTRSDTEVLVHLYEERGLDMAVRLHGMFAFAIWDARQRLLLIARDRTGMKPLSYSARDGGVVFCSELRSLYAFDAEKVSVSPRSVMQYLAFGYVPSPATIFEGVHKLPPAHVLLWSQDKGIEVHRYWSAPHPESAVVAAEEELVAELRERLDAAVASHLEAEVPVGAFLSGGLDSSTVVALMARHAQGRVRTFSIGFAEASFDESEAARAVATELGTSHRDLLVRPDIEEIFDAIATMFDEPFADSSAIPTFLVAQLARQAVTVALSGDGGDELFGGYERYRETLAHPAGHPSSWRRLIASIGLLMPHMAFGRNRLIDIGRSRTGRYAATLVQPLRLDEGGVARSDHPGSGVRVGDQLQERFDDLAEEDFASAMMRVDLETYLSDDILTKVDRTSMAVSLEARVPLLDADLVEFAFRLPGELRVTVSESKRLFRRALVGLVPNSVLSRPKRGFEIPLGRWFRGPLRSRIETLRSPSNELQAYVDVRATQRVVREHLMGRRDHGGVLWRLMVLDRWLASLRARQLGRPPAVPGLRVEERTAT